MYATKHYKSESLSRVLLESEQDRPVTRKLDPTRYVKAPLLPQVRTPEGSALLDPSYIGP